MWHFDAETLRLLVRFVSSDSSEAGRIVRTAEHDVGLLTAILQDPRVHARLLETPHEFIAISPHAFFAALLFRVRADFATRTFTYERDSGRAILIFDVDRVRALLADDEVVAYLSWVLASFVRVNTVTRTVRVRKATWRRFTVSDYDIPSLIGYAKSLDPARRPIVFRRIGEVALFQTGVFADSFCAPQPRGRLATTLGDLAEIGVDAFRRAIEGGVILPEDLEAVRAVHEAFGQAAKALTFMTDHYLGPLRTKVFAQR